MRQSIFTMRYALLVPFAMFAGNVLAQTQAPQLSAVTNACLTSDSACQSAVTSHLNSLRDLNLPAAEYNQAVADLVVALATVANDNEACNDDDRRFATAISYSGTFANDPAQAKLIGDISDAVAACNEIQTAALADFASPN